MSSDSEFEEIKVSAVKDKLEEKQKELLALNKKRSRKKQKNSKNLLDKYKSELTKDIEITNKNTLIKNKKFKNVKTFSDEDEADLVYEKNDFILKVLDDTPKFKQTAKEVLEFRNKHFFGGRVVRTKLNKILSTK